MKKILFTLLLIGAFMFTGSAFAATISDATVAVGTASGPPTPAAGPDSTVSVTVTCDGKAGTVGGVAFTLVYDKDKFSFVELTKDTIFVAEPLGDYCDGTIAGCTENPYTLATNPVSKTDPAFFYQANAATTPGEVKIAAASAVGVTGSKVLFKATFKIKAGVEAGDYPIVVKKTSVNNTEAGYPATGQDIPILVGMPATAADASGYYPVQEEFNPVTPADGKITVVTNVLAGTGDVVGVSGVGEGGNGVDIDDLFAVLDFYLGTSTPTANQLKACDFNKDGKVKEDIDDLFGTLDEYVKAQETK